jgi:hypothetical protein
MRPDSLKWTIAIHRENAHPFGFDKEAIRSSRIKERMAFPGFIFEYADLNEKNRAKKRI